MLASAPAFAQAFAPRPQTSAPACKATCESHLHRTCRVSIRRVFSSSVSGARPPSTEDAGHPFSPKYHLAQQAQRALGVGMTVW